MPLISEPAEISASRLTGSAALLSPSRISLARPFCRRVVATWSSRKPFTRTLSAIRPVFRVEEVHGTEKIPRAEIADVLGAGRRDDVPYFVAPVGEGISSDRAEEMRELLPEELMLEVSGVPFVSELGEDDSSGSLTEAGGSASSSS